MKGAREGLVQETRTDKNGKPVRRWVKPQGTSTARAVPPPSVGRRGPADSLDAIARGAATLLSLPESVVRQTRDRGARYSEDTLRRVAAVFEDGRGIGVAGTTLRMVIHGHPETALREFVAFAPRIDHAVRSSAQAEAAVRALHRYDEGVVPRMEDLTLADEATQARCRALVAVAYGMAQLDWHLTSLALDEIDPAEDGDDDEYEPEDEPMPAIKDWGLIRLLHEHPEDADDIVALIGMHGFESADRLREMLYDGSRSLAAGHL